MTTTPSRPGSFWSRHRRLFWLLHSVWALATGVVVMVLAHDRFGFVPWVVVALVLTWASTLYFGRRGAVAAGPTDGDAATPGLGHEVSSYVTRVLYQETLFFLLPLYAASTVFTSRNVVFVLLLAALAVLSCLDLVFDRLLRTQPTFGLLFFATIAFAALNLLLPLLAAIGPEVATPVAAIVALGSAVPLALQQGATDRRARVRLGLAAAAILGVALGLPSLVPPVPLRLQRATFAAGIDRDTLALRAPLERRVAASTAPPNLVVLVEVFAPVALPTVVRLEWRHDGVPVHTSRDVQVLAHGRGFRVWDGWRSGHPHAPPGRYEVVATTAGGRVFGEVRLEVEAGR